MKVRMAVLVAICSVGSFVWAQQIAKPAIKVKAASGGDIPLGNPAWIDGSACDRDGNLYIRPVDKAIAGSSQMFQVPVVKISPAGKLIGEFKIAQALPGGGESRTFAVHDGAVYVPTGSRNGGYYVVKFASDGSVAMRTRLALDSFVDIFHLAVFNSGEYLVVGEAGSKTKTPFKAVFAADGRKLKEIYEPEDEEARQRAEGGDSSYTYSSGLTNKFVVLADATAGSDGNVYLLHGPSPLIYVISPSGEVVRKLHIDAGQLTADSIKFYDGRLAIGFNWLDDTPETLVKIVDLNGRHVADYEIGETPSDFDPVLACYNAAGAMLIPRGADASLRLVKAVLP